MIWWSFGQNAFILHLLGISLIWSSEAVIASAKKKVCVIGAGPAGLASVKRAADHADEFDVVAFERNSDVGGQWLYSKSSDVDEHNLPVHSSMYKYMRTNIPKEAMTYPDYQNFTGEEWSAVSHRTICAYLRNFTNHFNLRQYIQFNTLVEKVTPVVGDGDWRTTTWQITTRNLNTNEIFKTICDAVMVCNGHFSVPSIPKIPGIKTFPGKVIHSHVYRKPEDFANRTVIILGASSSGVDISIEISKFAKRVYLSHNHDKIAINQLPSNVVQVFGVASANGNTLTLRDGSNVTADSFIFCTGYLFTYQFLDESSGIRVEKNYVAPLYKHLVNIEHPSMSFVGVPRLPNYPMYYVQTRYYVSLLRGKVQLPSRKDMLAEFKVHGEDFKRELPVTSDKPWTYFDELAVAGGFQKIPTFYRRAYEVWIAYKSKHLPIFREAKLRVLSNDKVELVPPNESKD